MRYTIQNLSDITDSREIMDAKPHKFGLIFINILLALITTAVLWAYFSEKEIVIKANGIVRPNEESLKISNKAAGKIEKINFKEGDKVKAGEILYVIEHTDILLQKESYEKGLAIKEKELSNWNKLLESINDNINKFSKENSEEADFYNKYLNYFESIKDTGNQRNILESQLKALNENLQELNKYKRSIEDNKNYFESGSIFYNQYLDYSYSMDSLNNKLKEAKKLKDNLSEAGASQEQIDQAQSVIESAEKEIQKLKNSAILSVKTSIEQVEGKIDEAKLSQEGNNSIEKFKTATIVNINDNIKLLGDKIAELKLNIGALDMKVKDSIIKAPADGIISITNTAENGAFIQGGLELASILPESSSKYKLEMYISNKDIGNVKEGQDIKCNFLALPQKDFGSVGSKLTNMSVDAKVNRQEGTSYYTAEAVIDNQFLENHKGEQAYIKPGMIFEAQIVNRRVKYLYYFLEKINLKD